eukprot:74446_1
MACHFKSILLLLVFINVIYPITSLRNALIKREYEKYGYNHKNINNDDNYIYNNKQVYYSTMTESNYPPITDEELGNIVDEDTHKYSHRRQWAAFLLSLCLGSFGAGRFYTGHYITACLKLILYLCLVIGPCVILCCFLPGIMRNDSINHDQSSVVIGLCLYVCIVIAMSLWIIIDIILFASNDITDGYGLTLQPM